MGYLFEAGEYNNPYTVIKLSSKWALFNSGSKKEKRYPSSVILVWTLPASALLLYLLNKNKERPVTSWWRTIANGSPSTCNCSAGKVALVSLHLDLATLLMDLFIVLSRARILKSAGNI